MNKSFSSLVKIFIASLCIFSLSFAQLEVGDISPDFSSPVCANGEDVNPDFVNGDEWSLYDEGLGKVTWLYLFTSW